MCRSMYWAAFSCTFSIVVLVPCSSSNAMYFLKRNFIFLADKFKVSARSKMFLKKKEKKHRLNKMSFINRSERELRKKGTKIKILLILPTPLKKVNNKQKSTLGSRYFVRRCFVPRYLVNHVIFPLKISKPILCILRKKTFNQG